MRRRLDAELLRRGLVSSRTEAQEAIRSGLVSVSGMTMTKASTMVAAGDPLVLGGRVREYVSRGGLKLAAALDRFEIDPSGQHCLDAGASTGGFTDCLLNRGAAAVIAVDVGYGQLDWTLRNDGRVTVMERTNVRDLDAGDVLFAPSLVVADLSFISLSKVIPALSGLAADEARMVLLVKPQFEAGKGSVGDGGVVRDPGTWRQTIEAVAGACERSGVVPIGVMASPVRGPAGNVEFLLTAAKGARASEAIASLDVDRALADGLEVRGGA